MPVFNMSGIPVFKQVKGGVAEVILETAPSSKD